jgi:DNA-binding NarL/FixJ family response regulator
MYFGGTGVAADEPGKIPLAIRILIADDLEVVRRGLQAVLQVRPGWEVCGEAGDGIQALRQAQKLKPDIAILDIELPNLDTVEVTRQILEASPQTKVLILALDYSDHVIREGLKAGARGLLLKADAARDLASAIEALLQNKTYVSSKIAAIGLDRSLNRSRIAQTISPADYLTPREREIVELLTDGKTAKEVAATLELSVKTVETHRSNVMRKLQIHSVSELVLYAVRHNIIRAAASQGGVASSLAPALPTGRSRNIPQSATRPAANPCGKAPHELSIRR